MGVGNEEEEAVDGAMKAVAINELGIRRWLATPSGPPSGPPVSGVSKGVEAAILEQLIEIIDAALFVVDEEGQLVVANARGQGMLDDDRDGETHALLLRAGDPDEGSSGADEGSAERVQANAHVGLHVWRKWIVDERGRRLALTLIDSVQSATQRVLDVAAKVWRLTPRQKDVFRLVLDGCSNKEIGDTLQMAIRTVEVHIGAALDKAGVDSRSRLIARAWTLRE